MIDQLKATLPNTPVILLTGVLFDPKVFHETLGHKVSCYLMKTTPLSRIRDEIARLLRKYRGPSPATVILAADGRPPATRAA
jgi:DNA-binding NarL/FixJ family response regulator